jgi:hypothetical protein
MDDLLFVAGLLIVVLTGTSVVLTVILPRRPRGVDRITLGVNRCVRTVFTAVSRLARTYEGKDSILAVTGPVALLGQLLVWLALFVLGYSLMLEPFTHQLPAAFVQDSVALFTVGTGHGPGRQDQVIDLATGATWAVVVALQIAYLPALYSAVNRREALVFMLESRAGLPAWGPELLARHQLVGISDTLPDFYAQWEQWSADVAESHTTYPVLLLFRSPEAWYSWLIGLLAVLDGAAMHLALAPDSASSQARLCLRMGFTAINRIATTLGWEPESDPSPEGPIDLTYDEFEAAVRMLNGTGFPIERPADEAWPDFRGWRVNYETTAYRLADRLLAPPAPWSGPRRHLPGGPVAPRRPPQRRPTEALPERDGGEPGGAAAFRDATGSAYREVRTARSRALRREP